MQEFEYVAPATIEEAVKLMSESGVKARGLAGGTDIIIQLRALQFVIDRLVDLKNIPELQELSYTEKDGLKIGAAVACHRIYEDPTVQKLYPGLIDCSSLIGGIQIQGRASIGGNLCNATPSGDSIPAQIALNATCDIAGPNGRRSVPVADFCIGVRRSVLEEGEILVSLNFPTPPKNSGAHFLRFIPRNEMDIAVANSGVSVVLDDSKQKIVSAIIALGSVAPTVVIAKEAMAFLQGKDATEENCLAAGEAAKSAAVPINDMRGTIKQRTHLVGVLTKRALVKAIARARGEE
jgi:carbon-monoxide dehydrogenase medium subunit